MKEPIGNYFVPFVWEFSRTTTSTRTRTTTSQLGI